MLVLTNLYRYSFEVILEIMAQQRNGNFLLIVTQFSNSNKNILFYLSSNQFLMNLLPSTKNVTMDILTSWIQTDGQPHLFIQMAISCCQTVNSHLAFPALPWEQRRRRSFFFFIKILSNSTQFKNVRLFPHCVFFCFIINSVHLPKMFYPRQLWPKALQDTCD